MRKASLPHFQNGEWWFVSAWSGSLFRSSRPPRIGRVKSIFPKVKEALAICDDPYSCRWVPDPDQCYCKSEKISLLSWLDRYFTFLGNQRFFVSTACAGYNLGLFETTREAFTTMSYLPGLGGADDNCLRRSLLAAMTSKSFVRSGVLFIGAELSTGEMHAWIIENGEQPDPEDRSWINYRPLLALYK